MLQLNRKELISALKAIAPTMKQNKVIPLLECCLIQITDNICYVSGTDNNLYITSTFPLQADDIEFCINYGDISRLLPTLIAEQIQINILENLMHLTSNKDRFKLPTVAHEQYPKPTPILSPSVEIDIEQDFIDAMKEAAKHDPGDKVIFSNFEGCCINFLSDKVEVAGGHNRFFICTLPYAGSGQYHVTQDFITAISQPGMLSLSENNIQLHAGAVTITCGLSPHKFADYHAIFPKEEIEANVFFLLSNLLPKLDSVLSFNDANFTKVVLKLKSKSVEVVYENSDKAREFTGSFPCSNTFGEDEICFNASFLKAILLSTGASDVQMYIISGTQPAYFIAPGYKTAIAPLQK